MCDCYEDGTAYQALYDIYNALSYEIRKADLDVSSNLKELIESYNKKYTKDRNNWVWPNYNHKVTCG